METSKDVNDPGYYRRKRGFIWKSGIRSTEPGKIQKTEWGRAMFKEIMAKFFPELIKHNNP